MKLWKRPDPIPREALLFSRLDFIKLIIPLFLQQVLNVTVGTVDSMMVAYAGEAAVSGVSLVNSLDTVLVIFFTALIAGGGVVVAQALGSKDDELINNSAKQLLYVSVAMATLLTVTVLVLQKPLLSLLFGDVEPAVMQNAGEYFFFVALSFPLLAINESIGACFRSSGNTLVSLVVSLIINLVNVGGNALLIIGFEMGAMGAAISTAFSRLVGAVILLILIHQKRHPIHIEHLFHYRPNLAMIKRILHIGVPNGVENCMFQFGRLLTQTLISTMGTSVIAANAVALTICNFQYITGTACSTAMIPIVGRCIGAQEERQAKYYSRVILAVCYAILWAVILFTLIFLNPLVSAYGLSDASAALSKQLILYHALFAAAIWPIGFMLPSAFRAANDVRFPMVISMSSMWLFRVVGAYVMALEQVSVFGLFTFPGFGMGIMGVWIAMTVDWVVRVAIYTTHYVSGRWLRFAKLRA